LPDAKGPAEDEGFLASKGFVAMYLWYALLSVVIEGFRIKASTSVGRWVPTSRRWPCFFADVATPSFMYLRRTMIRGYSS
jgi:hypothetical protein